MGGAIAEGVKVKITGMLSWDRGAVGVVKTIRPGWTGKEAVVVVPGLLGPREVTVRLGHLSAT